MIHYIQNYASRGRQDRSMLCMLSHFISLIYIIPIKRLHMRRLQMPLVSMECWLLMPAVRVRFQEAADKLLRGSTPLPMQHFAARSKIRICEGSTGMIAVSANMASIIIY
jgi:hypothetical protein